MKFYKDEIEVLLKKNNELNHKNSKDNVHYHEWTPKSISRFWSMHTNSLINRQFYPVSYWYNLMDYVKLKIAFEPKVIVNIGTGNGNMEQVLLQLFPASKIIGIDLTENSLQYAKDRFKKEKRVNFLVGSATNLNIDEKVNMIVMTEVLEHLFMDDFIKTFQVISKNLKTGGYFIGTCPFKEELSFVACPECGCLYQPNQHMIIDISQSDIETLCSKNGMKVIYYYQGVDRNLPPVGRLKIFLKRIMLKILPDDILSKVFPFNGASGFIATKL